MIMAVVMVDHHMVIQPSQLDHYLLTTVVINGGSSYGNVAKSVAPSSYDNGGSYGGSSYGNTAKSVGSLSFDNGGNNGGSSYGNVAQVCCIIIL